MIKIVLGHTSGKLLKGDGPHALLFAAPLPGVVWKVAKGVEIAGPRLSKSVQSFEGILREVLPRQGFAFAIKIRKLRMRFIPEATKTNAIGFYFEIGQMPEMLHRRKITGIGSLAQPLGWAGVQPSLQARGHGFQFPKRRLSIHHAGSSDRRSMGPNCTSATPSKMTNMPTTTRGVRVSRSGGNTPSSTATMGLR